jgi:hypothetical protein
MTGGEALGPGAHHPPLRGRPTVLYYIDEPGPFGIRPEPAAPIVRRRGGQTRRAPGVGGWSVGEIAEVGASGVEFFRKRRRLAAGSSFGICQEPLTVALSANGSNRPFAVLHRPSL